MDRELLRTLGLGVAVAFGQCSDGEALCVLVSGVESTRRARAGRCSDRELILHLDTRAGTD